MSNPSAADLLGDDDQQRTDLLSEAVFGEFAKAGGDPWKLRKEFKCCCCREIFSGHPIQIPYCRPCQDRHGPLAHSERVRIVREGATWEEVMAERREPKSPKFEPNRLVIPPLFHEASASMDVVGWVDRWEKERIRKPLILTGSVGVGKTYQGVGALRAIGVRTTTGKLILVNCVRLDWATRQEMDEWADSRALLLDDFGVKLSPSALARVYELVDRRTTDLRPLIVTTNLDITQAFKLDERIASRLSEGFWLTLDGVDRRVKR